MDCLKTLSPNLKNELSINRSIMLKISSLVKLSFFLLWNHLAVLLVIWIYLLCPPLKALSTISYTDRRTKWNQQSTKFIYGITSPHPNAFYKSNVKITIPHWNFTCPQWLLPAFGRWVGVNVGLNQYTRNNFVVYNKFAWQCARVVHIELVMKVFIWSSW